MPYQTELKKALMEYLNEADKPCSVQEIEEALAAIGITKNKTSIYRQLEALERVGKVTKTTFSDSISRYEKPKEEHVHFKCVLCDGISCVHMNPVVTKELAGVFPEDYSICAINIELSGVCPGCTGHDKD